MKTLRNIIAALALLITLSSCGQQAPAVTSAEFATFSKQNTGAIILDVRTTGEFAEGHIKNAVHIDISGEDFSSKIAKLDKSKTYLVYCRTKNRSGRAVSYMKEQGFAKVYQMTDGIVGWNENKLPLVK